MANESLPEVGSVVTIQKPALELLFSRLKAEGYQLAGPVVKNGTLVYDALESMEDLPQGRVSEQQPGKFRLVEGKHNRYFDAIPGAPSWKQFLFPSRAELFKLRKNGKTWENVAEKTPAPKYAFIGVRACELAAIEIQDAAFMRADFTDPIYRARREQAFILSVNCLHPAATCFCASMNTGPRVKSGFDINLTELDDLFVLNIGSELGRRCMAEVPFENASGFVQTSVERGLENAAKAMGRALDTTDLPGLLLDNLDNEFWAEVEKRCLSCANCTQVCPTCFCWDAVDVAGLDSNSAARERVWDSCFNPAFSYQAGGYTRLTIKSRYRQWISHKLGSWKQQYGTFGCVGCGRCITWCPSGIDITEEVAALRKETGK